jgi:hypothetical protein
VGLSLTKMPPTVFDVRQQRPQRRRIDRRVDLRIAVGCANRGIRLFQVEPRTLVKTASTNSVGSCSPPGQQTHESETHDNPEGSDQSGESLRWLKDS